MSSQIESTVQQLVDAVRRNAVAEVETLFERLLTEYEDASTTEETTYARALTARNRFAESTADLDSLQQYLTVAAGIDGVRASFVFSIVLYLANQVSETRSAILESGTEVLNLERQNRESTADVQSIIDTIQTPGMLLIEDIDLDALTLVRDKPQVLTVTVRNAGQRRLTKVDITAESDPAANVSPKRRSVGTLQPGVSRAVKFTVKPDTLGDYLFTFTVTATGGSEDTSVFFIEAVDSESEDEDDDGENGNE